MTIAAWPGCSPRLLRDQPSLQSVREHYAAYRDRGGYRPLASTDELLDEVERSGLLGRGGAAFPLAMKLRTVRGNGIRRNVSTVVVANGCTRGCYRFDGKGLPARIAKELVRLGLSASLHTQRGLNKGLV